jgi:hypothetical protein
MGLGLEGGISMDAFTGVLYEGDRVLADPVRGWHEFTRDPDGVSYLGNFLMFHGETGKAPAKGGTYRLTIKNGPELYINIKSVEASGEAGQIRLEFESTGKLTVFDHALAASRAGRVPPVVIGDGRGTQVGSR